ncbi:glycosyltransferase family 4 protein [Mucilaginibacter rubeus]|uniref:Glycosyltransferase family 4 protein n=1 Tax=Mucilaginibacter rubeus TaxID=2027860 RepID=A0AAE6JH15_9SPHI|nr:MULTISPECIES: glycosyltransferase family 4 protein [Mucilaginibacter]QEM05411.1 glycosyltransferase family 4 protein [Mucilaginibacter rubeus]QEM17997.1 glycosyltransferase family 4 protein [Mucilaginibacter gossypii]QTE45468.1 glycosyltransferase family 4 protein [Mucilaginibacter rubeus]QTE52065.1 glycosyltransferase family 4 protein [Mucilaginibacter rubeus]QTE57153.1 glycosyltransferase family 4 protein [Mucilaginibacter rubeus]
MKVAVLAPVAWRTPPRHYGPWEQIASNITEGIIKMGAEVTLFATGDSITAGKLDAICETGYEEDRTQDAKVLECLHISNLMEKAGQFDIIHNNFDFLPLTYSGLIKTPLLTTIHGFSSSKIIPVYKKYNSRGHYVSISNADRSPELDYLATVYNGLDTRDFQFYEQPHDYLLYFGRIHPDKGTAEAIDIAKKSKRKLLIAGIVQDTNYFKEKIEPLFCADVEYIGHAGPDKRRELLGRAYALLHPISFDEPFGLSVAEAMLCGTPVIAFNRGSMPELIKNAQTGFLVNTVDEAAEAVGWLRQISRADCYNWANSQFSSDKMVKDYWELYNRVLD